MSDHNGKILNPATGRWISATGKIGKAILQPKAKPTSKAKNTIQQPSAKKVKSNNKDTVNKRKQMPFKKSEITANYLILNTGFTERLGKILAKDPKKCELRMDKYEEADCEIVMLCGKDGEKTYTEDIDGNPYVTYDEGREIDELVTNWDEQHSGVMVIRLNILPPFDALKLFHKAFGYKSKMDYCAPHVFDGMPIEDVSVFKKGDGAYDTKFLYMCFDSAYVDL